MSDCEGCGLPHEFCLCEIIRREENSSGDFDCGDTALAEQFMDDEDGELLEEVIND